MNVYRNEESRNFDRSASLSPKSILIQPHDIIL